MVKTKIILVLILLACSLAFLHIHDPKLNILLKANAQTTKVNVCGSNSVGKELIVSIGQQHLWVCDNQQLVNQSAVTTGKTVIVNGVDDSTPTGSWKITGKDKNVHLKGSDANGSWDDPVKYWMPYDGDIGFHDASWQTFTYGSSQYKTDGSHGCIHLPLDMMSWIYGWSTVGTAVTVQS